MTTALKYYAHENKTHLDMQQKICTQDLILKIVKDLCAKADLPAPEVRFHLSRRGHHSSGYQPPAEGTEEFITFEEGGVSCLVVAHEVAHYLHFHNYMNRKAAFVSVHGPQERFVREKWHGPEHRHVTETCIEYIRAQGWHLPEKAPAEREEDTSARAEGVGQVYPSPVPPEPEVVEEVNDQPPTWVQGVVQELLAGRTPAALSQEEVQDIRAKVRDRFLLTLPERMHCPKCACDKDRSEFGVRIMNRAQKGARSTHLMPTKLARQSQCRSCRLKFSKE